MSSATAAASVPAIRSSEPAASASVATPQLTTEPSLPPIDGSYFDDGWTVVASLDASGPDTRSAVHARVAADSVFEFVYACESRADITITIVDAEEEVFDPEPRRIDPRMVANLSTQCTTAVDGFAGMGPDHATSLGIETTLEPDVHYWVLVAVPDDDVIR